MVSLEVNIPDTIRLKGDRQAFVQIANNLLNNACTALREGGKIVISGEEAQKGYTLYFKDNGPGIDKKIAYKIFEPFTTTSQKGTGLGLAIVKSLCEAMNWNIILLSSAKGSTCFAIRIKEYSWEKS